MSPFGGAEKARVGRNKFQSSNLLSTIGIFCKIFIIILVVGAFPGSVRGAGVPVTARPINAHGKSLESPTHHYMTPASSHSLTKLTSGSSFMQAKTNLSLSSRSVTSRVAGQASRGGEVQESKTLAVDKSPPQLQLGLSSTVPFVSISADKLMPGLSSHHSHYHSHHGNKNKIQNQEKSFGVDPYHHHDGGGGNDEPWDLGLGHLLKFKFGGLLIAAVVGVAALVLFIPTVFGARFPPHGGVLMPSFIHQLMPGLGGFGDDYSNYYAPGGGGSFGGYSSTSYNNLYKSEDGGVAGHGRSLARPVRGNNGTTVQKNPIISTVQRTAKNYWNHVEICAAHAMCLRGKEMRLRERAAGSKNDSHGADDNGKGGEKGGNLEQEVGLTSFEHVLETMNGMKGMTRNMPMFHQLYKAFKTGQSDSTDCTTVYQQCPAPAAMQISKALKNMGKYIFT